jgi:hypothetical protein
VRNPALRPVEPPPTMFRSIITTRSPLPRNSAAALIPLNPPPTMSTSQEMSLLSGGQYLNCLIRSVVNHQF